MFRRNQRGNSPFTPTGPLDSEASPGAGTDYPDCHSRSGVLLLKDAISCNGSGVESEAGGAVRVTTLPVQWAFACAIPLREPEGTRLAEDPRLSIRVRATVESGRIGASIVSADFSTLVSPEHHREASVTETVFHLELESPRAGLWLVLRNTAPDGTVSRVRVHGVQVAAVLPPGSVGTAVLPPIELEPAPPPVNSGFEVFDTPEARAINRARIQHLAGLGLPIAGKCVIDVGCGVGHLSQFFADQGCRIVCVDARGENLGRLRELYPGREAHLLNVETDSLTRLGRFDIVFCYGLLYHCENPVAALRNMASCCAEMLLLETVVTDHPQALYRLTQEPRGVKNQAMAGFGCRPSPAFVVTALSGMGFPFIYSTLTRPDFPDFQVEWKGNGEWKRGDQLLRCVFVASRARLDFPALKLLAHTPAVTASPASEGCTGRMPKRSEST